MIRSIEKLKVRIDQNLNRAEKSEALREDVVKVESKVTSLKQVLQQTKNCNVMLSFALWHKFMSSSFDISNSEKLASY